MSDDPIAERITLILWEAKNNSRAQAIPEADRLAWARDQAERDYEAARRKAANRAQRDRQRAEHDAAIADLSSKAGLSPADAAEASSGTRRRNGWRRLHGPRPYWPVSPPIKARRRRRRRMTRRRARGADPAGPMTCSPLDGLPLVSGPGSHTPIRTWRRSSNGSMAQRGSMLIRTTSASCGETTGAPTRRRDELYRITSCITSGITSLPSPSGRADALRYAERQCRTTG